MCILFAHRKTKQKTRLAHTRVSDQEQFEQVVTAKRQYRPFVINRSWHTLIGSAAAPSGRARELGFLCSLGRPELSNIMYIAFASYKEPPHRAQ